MWIPNNEEEIESVVNNGTLQETASFDAKAQVTSNNIEIAKDIAAMTNDGGVIIYGIGEDENKRLTILSPVELAGQPERITSIVQSSISEPPTINVLVIHTASNPTTGYIIVEIPPSPRAPHMVTVRGNNRFYGRNSTGNYKLNEGEVARLYARRQQTEINRDAILQQEIERYPFEANPNLAYLYAFVRPVFPQSNNLLERACREGESIEDLLWRLAHMSKSQAFTRDNNYSPQLERPYNWISTVDGYRGDSLRGDSLNGSQPLNLMIRLEIDNNGNGHLFCGRAAESLSFEGRNNLYFFPSLVAGNVAKFLYLFGTLYNQAEYYGHVDLGIAVTGLYGCMPYISKSMIWMRSITPFDQNEYRQTTRCSSSELFQNPQNVGSTLVTPLIRAITQSHANPFLE